MRIPKKADVLSEFHCPKYPDLKKITYRVCVGRQLARTPGLGWLYSECAGCKDGTKIKNHFKDYKPEKRKTPNWNTKGCVENQQKIKRQKQNSIVKAKLDCLKCKTLLQAQVEFAIQLCSEEKYKETIRRLEMIFEEVCNI